MSALGNFEDLPDGGFVVHGVKLLAEGDWTDSMAQTPLYYTKDALREFATNWADNGVWSRHTGGMPRNITDKVGEVLNPRYSQNDSAVVGDLYLHGKTQQSRDTIALIKAKQANYVSVEHGGAEAYNKETRRNESKSLIFTGLAIVNRGACGKCTIRSNEAAPADVEASASTSITQPEAHLKILNEDEKMTDHKEAAAAPETVGDHTHAVAVPQTEAVAPNKELEEATAKAASLAKELEGAKAALTDSDAKAKELAEKLAKVEGENKALAERVKALEALPATPKTMVSRENGAEIETKMPAQRVRVDRKRGEVYFE